MPIKSKNITIILATLFLVLSPILSISGFLCSDGFRLGMIYYALIIILLLTQRKQATGFSLKTLMGLQILFLAAAPIGMLLHSGDYGGLSFFLAERLSQYLYLEASALVVLFFSSSHYMSMGNLYTGKPARNLRSPFTIVIIALTVLLIILEFSRLWDSSSNTGAIKLEYLVVPSIPLYMAAVTLGTLRNPVGYAASLILSLIHLVLTPVLIQNSVVSGIEGTLIILFVIVASFFSIKGIMEYHFHNHKKLPKAGYAIMRTMLRLKGIFGKASKVLELAGINEGMTILDYGCGTGNFSIIAAKMTGSSGQVLCADKNEKMLSIIQKRSAAETLSQIKTLLVQSPNDIPDSGFQFILLIDVLHLIEDKVTVVHTLLEKLAKDGKLLIKFEHFTPEQIEQFLQDVGCKNKTQLFKSYWLLV